MCSRFEKNKKLILKARKTQILLYWALCNKLLTPILRGKTFPVQGHFQEIAANFPINNTLYKLCNRKKR